MFAIWIVWGARWTAVSGFRFIIRGPEGILSHEAVKQTCRVIHPEIKKVTTMPYWLATLIALITGQQRMKRASDFMAAFEKTGERGDPTAANAILGAPTIRLEDWLRKKTGESRRAPACRLNEHRGGCVSAGGDRPVQRSGGAKP